MHDPPSFSLTTISSLYLNFPILMTYNRECHWQFKHFPKHRIKVGWNVVVLVINLLLLAAFANLHFDIGIRLHNT